MSYAHRHRLISEVRAPYRTHAKGLGATLTQNRGRLRAPIRPGR